MTPSRWTVTSVMLCLTFWHPRVGKRLSGKDNRSRITMSLQGCFCRPWGETVSLPRFHQCAFGAQCGDKANFRPYAYWPLVLLSCAITQHISTIFIFLATFVRIKEKLLDPRTVVWITVVSSVVGYATWELLDFAPAKASERYANRSLLAYLLGPYFSLQNRPQSIEIIDTDFPCTHVTLTSVENAHCCHIIGLYMGSLCDFVYP